MDILTLAMAKPKILDSTKFRCNMNGIPATLNEVLLYLLQASLQKGAPAELTVEDIGDELKKQAHTKRPLYVETFDGKVYAKFPLNISYTETMPCQLSAYGTTKIDGVGLIAMDFVVQFTYSEPVLTIFVNTKILKAGQ